MSSHTPGPAAKRRRVDAANATLKKPFRSPMINRPSPSTPGPSTTPSSTTKPTKAPPGTTPARPSSLAAGLLTTPTPSTTNETSPTRRRPTAAFTTPSTSKSTGLSQPASPSTTSPTTTHPGPQQNPPPLQTDEDPAIVEQALKITREAAARRPGEPVDAELKEATAKWRSAGRLAAEDLFELVKGRVAGMGMDERRGRRGWDDDDDFGREKRKDGERGCEEGSSQDNGEEYEESRERKGKGGEGNGGEAEGFTMLTMLRSLNIEPEILGYDPVEDKWKD